MGEVIKGEEWTGREERRKSVNSPSSNKLQ